MQNSRDEIYPHPKDDRRLAPAIPERGQSRRIDSTRYIGKINVSLFNESEESAPLLCTSLDLSLSGILLKLPKNATPPTIGNKCKVKFYLPAGTLPEGFESYIDTKCIITRVDCLGEYTQLALTFNQKLDEQLKDKRWKRLIFAAFSILFISLLSISYLRQDSIFYFMFDIPIFLYGILASLFLITRFAFAIFYKDVPVDPKFTPGVSIIIPCFNEEEWIEKTIQCCINQDYPQDKLEVILVDDGSTDKSMERVYSFAEKIKKEITGDRLIIMKQPQNMGKREALAAGALKSKFDFLIFVDSDSFLEPNAVKEIVQPFKDPKMGAVSGRTEVQNKWTNYITKMQAVRYYVAFRFFKSW